MQSLYKMNIELCTADHFRLNDILLKMVLNGSILNKDREELLHKAKLLKLKDGRWKDSDGAILFLRNHETIK